MRENATLQISISLLPTFPSLYLSLPATNFAGPFSFSTLHWIH
jgi:hypothetical protein